MEQLKNKIMRNPIIFFALFQSTTSMHSRKAIRKVYEEVDVVDDFSNWLDEETEKIQKEYNTSVVIVNCKIIR